MEQAYTILREATRHALATVDSEGHPRVRYFENGIVRDGSIYYATTTKKGVYQQIEAHPFIEIAALHGDDQVRAFGEVHFEVPEELQKELFDGCAYLKSIFKSYDEAQYIRLQIRQLSYHIDGKDGREDIEHLPEAGDARGTEERQ